MRISDWSSDGALPILLFGELRRLCNVADVDCRRADIECCARLAGGDIAQHAAVRRRLVILGAVGIGDAERDAGQAARSEEHTSELQSLMRISYAVFCLKKKNKP